MAKKQQAEKELKAKEAELGTDTVEVKTTEIIESEADSLSIEEIKSTTMVTPSGDFDWMRMTKVSEITPMQNAAS